MKETAQTYVDDLKEAGRFDEAARAIAKEDAVLAAKRMMTADVRAAVAERYGGLDCWLSAAIEAAVADGKKIES